MGGFRAPLTTRLGLSALVASALLFAGQSSRAGFVGDYAPPDPDYSPAMRYARLDRGACEEELIQRGVPFTSVPGARGVLAPVRFEGPLHGVTFRMNIPETQRMTSPWEIVDCRLALSLDDFAAQLAQHDVVEVIHLSMYRPPSAQWYGPQPGSRHVGALAIDAATFVKRDGETLQVERDFHGHIGAPTCGAGTGPIPTTPAALELRHILCDAADARLFNVMLTPDFNQPHYNHFHLEVSTGAKGFYVH